jgi:hypothetical protein
MRARHDHSESCTIAIGASPHRIEFPRLSLAPPLLNCSRVPQSAITAILITLNLALQLFDGVATYVCYDRCGEGNPMLRAGFEVWGAGPTLLLSKLVAALLLLFLIRASHRTLTKVGLTLTMVTYTVFSAVPWSYCWFY